MILRSLGTFLLLIPVVSMAAGACTCSQAPPGKCPGLQKGDVVFLGTVTGIENVFSTAPSSLASPGQPSEASAKNDQPAAPITRYHFRVDERFAGADAPEIDIFSGGDDGDCGYRFKNGRQYVVFTHPGTAGRLFATICSRTRPASDARALLPQLRAMRHGQRVASVFGVLRRSDPPFLALPDDPDDPLPNISLKLRSRDDRFETGTDAHGVYSFYDVHAGEYRFTANLPARMELTQKTLGGGLPPFRIPNGACYEYDVDALPTGHIRGSVLGRDGKPLALASVELFRAGTYADARPGLWGFQGKRGVFDFDHIGPGKYILVFNSTNRLDPNSPFPRAFYPGVADLSHARPIKLKDGQQLRHVNIKLRKAYPIRRLRVRLKWQDGRPPGSVTVMANADRGDNPAAQKIADGLYQFTLLESANYTISTWEDLTPQRVASRPGQANCAPPARIEASPLAVSGSDRTTKEVTLVFSLPACPAQ
jgi:hypothetical protein